MPVSVRYIVDDVDAAIPFYTDMLDFKVDMHFGSGFASLSRGDLRLLLNKPGGLRFRIDVADIETTVANLKAAGASLRSDVIAGRGGKQVLVDDRPVTRWSCSSGVSPSIIDVRGAPNTSTLGPSARPCN